MPAIQIGDHLLTLNAAGLTIPATGVYVRLVNNITLVEYITAARTTAAGLFLPPVGIPGGQTYTTYTKVNLTDSTWAPTGDANYFIPYGAGDTLKDASGNDLLSFAATPNAVNHIQVENAATGGIPDFRSVGSDAFIPMNFAAKGGSTTMPIIGFYGTDGLDQILILVNNYVGGAPNQVNYIEIDNGTTGVSPLIATQGVDGNVDLRFRPHGTGAIVFEGDIVPRNTIFRISQNGVAAANHIEVVSNAAGSAPQLQVQGTDATIGLTIVPKGGGAVLVTSNVGSQIVLDTAGNPNQNTSITLNRNGVGKWVAGNVQGTDVLQVYDVGNARQHVAFSPGASASAATSEFNSRVKIDSFGAFAGGDKYVIADASGNLHLSALGPAS